METMGERIKRLRESRGLSQTELGKRLGVTHAAVSHWERGKIGSIRLQTFLALCELFYTDPHYLIYGEARRRPLEPAGSSRAR